MAIAVNSSVYEFGATRRASQVLSVSYIYDFSVLGLGLTGLFSCGPIFSGRF